MAILFQHGLLASAQAPQRWTAAMLQVAAITLTNFGYQVGNSTYTYEFWLQCTGAGVSPYTTSYSGYNRFAAHMPYNGAWYYDNGGIDNLGRIQYTPPNPATFWTQRHHFAVQADYEHDVRRLFVDGVLVMEVFGHPNTYPETSRSGPDHLLLTGEQGGMGEVRYWNYIRTPEQIQAAMNLSLNGPQPGLLGCWRCDERGGTGTVIQDRSGFGRHGFIS
jgi:hypothetical protein